MALRYPLDAATKLIYLGTDLILPLTLGYYCRYRGWLSETICNQIIRLNIVVFCTLLAVLSFWSLPLNLELLWLPLFGILLSFIPGLAGYVTARGNYAKGRDKASYLASALLSNIGTLGGLCAFFVFGEPGFAYIQIIATFQNLVFFLFCFPMAQYYNSLLHEKTPGAAILTFSALFLNRNQLPVAGIIAGMLLYAGNVARPPVMGDLFAILIHVSAWTALFPVGYSIQFTEMKRYYHRIPILMGIKFIFTPLIGYLIAAQLFTDPVVIGTILIAASSPAGINAVVLARLYNFNVHLAGAAFVLTTALFLTVVYPILFFSLN